MYTKFAKTTLLKVILLFFVNSMAHQLTQAQQVSNNAGSNNIEVIYFHAPNRCPTCVANETQTKQVLEKRFNTEIASGKLPNCHIAK